MSQPWAGLVDKVGRMEFPEPADKEFVQRLRSELADARAFGENLLRESDKPMPMNNDAHRFTEEEARELHTKYIESGLSVANLLESVEWHKTWHYKSLASATAMLTTTWRQIGLAARERPKRRANIEPVENGHVPSELPAITSLIISHVTRREWAAAKKLIEYQEALMQSSELPTRPDPDLIRYEVRG